MTNDSYQPINCEFHDELEAASTLRSTVTLVLRGEDGTLETVQSVIADLGILTVDGVAAEYMTLKDGRRYRMDRIVSIDGKPRPL